MSDYPEYPKGDGVLFINNDRKSDKQPHFRGHIDITKEQLHALINMAKAGQPIKLECGAWKRVSKGGAKYIFIGTEAYMKQQQEQGWEDTPAQQQQAEEDSWEDDDLPF